MAQRQIRTPIGTAPVLPVMMMGMGAYLAWFGVHYWRSDTAWPSDPVKAVLTGKAIPVPDHSSSDTAVQNLIKSGQDAQAAQQAAIAAGLGGLAAVGGAIGPAAAAAGSVSGDKIASAALNYIGAGYVYGGKADKIGDWDCSSFTSFVLGHDCGLKLPGGKWGDPGMPPHAHGPATGNYMLFGKPVNASQVQKGDLVVSSTHMGIVVTTGTYMSAKSPSAGTGLGLYTSNFPGGSPVFRRVV